MTNGRAMRGAQTKRVYAWMDACKEQELVHYYAVAARPEQHLHTLAERVLHAESHRFDYPALVIGQYLFSWFENMHRRECAVIYMAKQQMCYMVLLHELTHALGYGTHSPAFVKKFISLLVKYGQCSEEKLTISAGLFGAL